MKSPIFTLLFLIIVSCFCSCKKENLNESKKQYLFDGLPYYLNDTLFTEELANYDMIGKPYQILFDSKGYAWIQTFAWAICRYDRKTNELISFTTKDLMGDIYPFNFNPIFIDSKDRLWTARAGKLFVCEGMTFREIPYDSDESPVKFSEDANGNIHFFTYYAGKDYICDGEKVTQVDPPFTNGGYKIYSMTNDQQGTLWYNIDLTADIKGDQGMALVKYRSDDDFVVIPEKQDNAIGEMIANEIFCNAKGTLFINMPMYDGLFKINENNQWEMVVPESIEFSAYKLFFDKEDRMWAQLAIFDSAPDPYKLAIFNNGDWIGESKKMPTIHDRNSVGDISFPDENTVWICTSAMLYEFKKE